MAKKPIRPPKSSAKEGEVRQPTKRTAAQRSQRILPGMDVTEFRDWLDFSSGLPVATTCPRCGYRW